MLASINEYAQRFLFWCVNLYVLVKVIYQLFPLYLSQCSHLTTKQHPPRSCVNGVELSTIFALWLLEVLYLCFYAVEFECPVSNLSPVKPRFFWQVLVFLKLHVCQSCYITLEEEAMSVSMFSWKYYVCNNIWLGSSHLEFFITHIVKFTLKVLE